VGGGTKAIGEDINEIINKKSGEERFCGIPLERPQNGRLKCIKRHSQACHCCGEKIFKLLEDAFLRPPYENLHLTCHRCLKYVSKCTEYKFVARYPMVTCKFV
jgi:hypothetical protein